MLSFQNRSGCLTLMSGERQVFFHSPEHPFITAIRREKTYEANRGTVKETVTEVERVPLTDVSQTGDTLVFQKDGHTVSVTVYLFSHIPFNIFSTILLENSSFNSSIKSIGNFNLAFITEFIFPPFYE